MDGEYSCSLTIFCSGVRDARAAANRWTDNVFLLKSWAEKSMGSRDDVSSYFKENAGIDFDTFDYPE